jgi:hypothetical protein
VQSPGPTGNQFQPKPFQGLSRRKEFQRTDEPRGLAFQIAPLRLLKKMNDRRLMNAPRSSSSPGRMSHGEILFEELKPERVVADKGYDIHLLRKRISSAGPKPVIPSRVNCCFRHYDHQ